MRLAGFLPPRISTANGQTVNAAQRPHTSTLPLHYILPHNRSIPYTSIHVHIFAMRIPALSLALLAVALSGSANGKPEAADPPTVAHRPTYLAADNAPTAFRQDTLAPSPTMDLIRRQSVSSLPSQAPPLPIASESPLAVFSLSSLRAFGARHCARPLAAFWSFQRRKSAGFCLVLSFFQCRSLSGADTRWGP